MQVNVMNRTSIPYCKTTYQLIYESIRFLPIHTPTHPHTLILLLRQQQITLYKVIRQETLDTYSTTVQRKRSVLPGMWKDASADAAIQSITVVRWLFLRYTVVQRILQTSASNVHSQTVLLRDTIV